MGNKTNNSVTILVVDDDEHILFAFVEVLKREGYRCLTTSAASAAVDLIVEHRPSLVFLDIAMPHIDGLQLLERIHREHPDLPVIMITGHGTMQTAIKAMQLGAFEYLTKPLDIEKIRVLTRRALASKESVALFDDRQARFKADVVDRYELIGNSPSMQEVYKTIGSVAMTPNATSVLITGESGTGKELVARAIHHSSHAAAEPFVAINCTALPENLLESELFGHEKGAFTGAVERKRGKFEIAQHGTIFLDEIGSIVSTLQQKLLRVLQEREFERVGGNERLQVDARFVAATNVDLESEVQNHTFRKDLFFRLNVVAIHLPPLRERREDIPLLANYFLKKYSMRIKKRIVGFSNDAMDLLSSYSFPGNVRQLENIIERAVIFSKGEAILPETIQETLLPKSAAGTNVPIVSPLFAKSRDHVLGLFEAQFLREQLKKHRGNVTAAAGESGMTRQNFQRLMKKHNIKSRHYR